MTEFTKKVSVIIPVHNSTGTLTRALMSILIQDVPEMEVIIFDDASVDDVVGIAERFDQLDIVYLRSEENVGAAEARNRAIDVSKGQYLAFLDADDEWLPNKLTIQMDLLDGSATASFVYCEAVEFEPGNRAIGYTNHRFARPSGPDAWRVLLRESCVTTSCVMARRDTTVEVGRFRPHLLSGQDQDLWIRLALAGDVIYQSDTLVHYYILSNSLSQRRHNSAVGDLLSVIKVYISENSHRLSESERREILAHRTRNAAKALYRSGQITSGLRQMRLAVAYGISSRDSIKFVVKNSPPVLKVKELREKPPIALDPQFNEGSVERPQLLVVVDTEEEFDWQQPFSRDNRSVESIQMQESAQEVFRRFDIRPVYVVDYAVADAEKAVTELRRFLDTGECLIGAHLHPWVNPPYTEEVNEVNSYPGNLPYDTEYKKLEVLTERICGAFGVRPTIYKAGRYGLGDSTPRILRSLGYKIDMSVVPYTDFRRKAGPDFSRLPARPFWMGDEFDIYEIPATCGFAGVAAGLGPAVYPAVANSPGLRLHLPGVLARSGLLERIPLTPEGMKSEAEMIRLVRQMYDRGASIFSLSYHSSSLMPGCNSYVRTESERVAFLSRLENFLEFFFGDLGGVATTPIDVYEKAHALRAQQ